MHSNTDTILKYRPRGAIPIPIPARGGGWKRYTTLTSTQVYLREAADGWIFLRSYLNFSYVRIDSYESIYDTSIIEVVDILCRNSPYYVAYARTWIFEPSVYLGGCEIE
jgi:hypothetical protein